MVSDEPVSAEDGPVTDGDPLRILDGFCCAGGAGEGYRRAGFEVIGIDKAWQPRYPFEFHRADMMNVLRSFAAAGCDAFRLAAIHISPPCQHYSDLAKRNGNADQWPDLVPECQELLDQIGLPYVIENVEGAPLRNPITLCGTMFDGLRVIRHRQFESNVELTAPEHPPHPLVFTHDKRKVHYGKLDQSTAFVQVTGGGNATVANKADAMGIGWMIGRELNEAIPPAYTEHVGRQLMAHIRHAQRSEAVA